MMSEQELRQALVDYGMRLLDADLVQGTWGNLSVRLDETHMLVTPSGLDYDKLAASDMAKVELSTLEWEGPHKPTSEKSLHQAIYLLRPEINAVIHTHSDACSVLAAARAPLPAKTEELSRMFGGTVAVARYGLPGTKALAKHTAAALGPRFAALMAHHGAVACGGSLDAAFTRCMALENAARAYIGERQPEAND